MQPAQSGVETQFLQTRTRDTLQVDVAFRSQNAFHCLHSSGCGANRVLDSSRGEVCAFPFDCCATIVGATLEQYRKLADLDEVGDCFCGYIESGAD